MKNKFKHIGFIFGMIALVFVACDDDIDPVVEKLDFERAFTPVNLTARIRNMITAELSWSVGDDVDHYVVEIAEDSLQFTTILSSVDVAPTEVPYSVLLEGETQYSARVKGVSNLGVEDSKWATVVFKTDAENIFNTLAGSDIGKTEVTLSWPAGSEVTHFIISTAGADDVRRDITGGEVAAGEATITGLAYGTEYGITMYNEPSPKQRGHVDFTTLPEGESLTPDMDLNEAINTTFADQDVFLLEAGEYSKYTGALTLNRSIKIKGLNSDDKPIVHVQFVLEQGAQNVEISNLEMDGTYTDIATGEEAILDYAFQMTESDVAYGSLNILSCDIHNYNKSLISAGSDVFEIGVITINDCLVSDIYNDGGDFIDSRKSYIANLVVTNSTFNNCATVNARDFIRMDGGTKGNPYDDGSRTPVIEVSHCTFNNVMNSESSTKRFFYVRWSQHAITSENNLFVDMGSSVYSNQSLTIQPECSGNNYFNADGYYTEAEGVLIDNSSNYTTLDPGFANPSAGDFAITNQTLLDNAVGDPRWW